jgi:predicted metal-binding membrane protein
MDLGLCGADLAGGTQALVRLRIALELNPPMQLVAPWLLMALAMAPPLVAASLRHFAITTADQSRYSIATFFAGYAVVWVLAVPIFLILDLGIDLLAAKIAAPPLAVAGTLALAWQASPWRRYALELCARSVRRTSPGEHPRGFETGLMTGIGCLGACWALMLAPMSLAADSRWPMVLITLFLLAERVVTLSPRHGRAGGPFTQSSNREPVTR